MSARLFIAAFLGAALVQSFGYLALLAAAGLYVVMYLLAGILNQETKSHLKQYHYDQEDSTDGF